MKKTIEFSMMEAEVFLSNVIIKGRIGMDGRKRSARLAFPL